MALTLGPAKYVGYSNPQVATGGAAASTNSANILQGQAPVQATAPALTLQTTTDPHGYISVPTTGGSGSGTGTSLNTGNGSGSGSGPSQAAIDLLMGQLPGIDTALNTRNDATNKAYDDMIGKYDQMFGQDTKNHDDSVLQNENTYTGNNWQAILNGINAYSGLRGVLSSLGALGGSGAEILNKLVGLATNADAGNARQTFDANAKTIGSAWDQAVLDDQNRRTDALTTRDNELSNNKAAALTGQQSIYEKLANLYGADDATGQKYAAKAAGFTPQILAATKTASNPYAKASSLFSPGELETYLAGTQNLNVNTSGGDSTTPVNSPVYATKSQKERLQGVA